jgi:radical SAM protein with 4Fe4S-binding SPASM domain
MVNEMLLKFDEELYNARVESGAIGEARRKNKYFRIPDDVVYVIPLSSYLRKDETQIIFYGNQFLETWANRLTPAQAAILALMDGRRSLGDLSRVLQEYWGGSKELNDYKVRTVLECIELLQQAKPNKLVVRNGQPFRQYDPKEFYIPNEQVELKVRLDKPTQMLWMPTSACQTDCVYCYATRRPVPKSELLPDGRVKELFEEAARAGMIKINVDGGDALCRENIAELIGHATSLGMEVDLSTKAYVTRELAQALYEAGIKRIQVGFDAPYPELFDRVVGRKGHFYRTVESIHNCANAGILPRTNSIIVQETYEHIHELVRLLHSLPIYDMKIATAFRSAYRYREGILLTEGQKVWLRQQIDLLKEKYPYGKIKFECKSDYRDLGPDDRAQEFARFPRCGVGTECMVITPDGRVTMCEQSPHSDEFVVGNVREQSLMDVWNSPGALNFKQVDRERFRGTVCYDCADFKTCFYQKGGCFIMSVKAYGTRYAPHPACPKAPTYKDPIQ